MSEPGATPIRSKRMGGGNNGGLDHARRIAALEGRMQAVETSVKAAVDNTAEILSILTYTRTGMGYAKKWGPRAVTFFMGLAIAKGWITAENGHSFLSIFGL